MSDIFNVYCDESCQLENDHQKVMALGAVWCPFQRNQMVVALADEIFFIHITPGGRSAQLFEQASKRIYHW